MTDVEQTDVQTYPNTDKEDRQNSTGTDTDKMTDVEQTDVQTHPHTDKMTSR